MSNSLIISFVGWFAVPTALFFLGARYGRRKENERWRKKVTSTFDEASRLTTKTYGIQVLGDDFKQGSVRKEDEK